MISKHSKPAFIAIAILMAAAIGGCGNGDGPSAKHEAMYEKARMDEKARLAKSKAALDAQYAADQARIKNTKMPTLLIGDAYSKPSK